MKTPKKTKNRDADTSKGGDAEKKEPSSSSSSSASVACDLCDKTFKSEAWLKRHRRLAHANDVVAETGSEAADATQRDTADGDDTTTTTETTTTTTNSMEKERNGVVEEDDVDGDEEGDDDAERILDETSGTLVPLGRLV